MKKLILASQSKARQKLLKSLGVSFRVMPAKIREQKASGKNPAKAVAVNALLKAGEVAGRLKEGLVIGCDTLVWQKGHVFGKPSSLKAARVMLKKLSSKPHRLFTGLAVVDAATKKMAVVVEETRIEMEPLTDEEITRYFRRVSPLDKAGGFDIQGLGSLFIRRIDGCYFNVIGLPIARLRVLLKKFGAALLSLLFCFLIQGCVTTEYNLATQQKDVTVYSTEREVAIGDSLAAQIEKNYKVVEDPVLVDRLNLIGEKVASVSDRHEFSYRFRIIEDPKDEDMVNAVSLPGGYVYVFKNLMKTADTDDELAAVLGHEIAHVAARHSIKRLQAIWGYNILAVLAGTTQGAQASTGIQFAYLQLMMGYSQEDELLADKMGAIYAKRAGYDPGAMVTFLDKLRKIQKKEKPQELTLYRTHPYYGQRVRAAKEGSGQHMDFDDFINTL